MGRGKQKNPLGLVEFTPPLKPIIGGLFKLADTLGFPLMMSILECEKRGWTPGLPAFVADAILAGWSADKAICCVLEAVREAHESQPRGSNELGMLEYGLGIVTRDPQRWATPSQ